MLKRNKVLIIEDDRDDYNKTKKLLESEQQFIVIPDSFDEWSCALDQNDHSVNLWDYLSVILRENENELAAVICDLRLNERDTGFDIINRIREEDFFQLSNPYINEIIPIIAYTNYPDREANAVARGATVSISKMSQEAILLETLKGQVALFSRVLTSFKEFLWPIELKSQIKKLINSGKTNAFLMTSFAKENEKKISDVKDILAQYDVVCHIANAPGGKYSDKLFQNIQVFMHGCDFGIGLYTNDSDKTKDEKIKINPNLSLEVGYMLAIGKPVCILKERELKKMNIDLADRLYCEFDENDNDALSEVIKQWLENKGFLSNVSGQILDTLENRHIRCIKPNH